ncbi:MAG: AfsR/SARP family transcriptional regulator, partial [Longimicrobiales bacterium]
MIRFVLFGSLELQDSTGAELRSVLSQPKRTALLAYLAAAEPRGWQRRDTLLALLWPEREEERARAALSKAVHHLRRALGEDALESRGNEELRLNPDLVWCDVAAFADALEAGEPERALALYRGELLEGFHLSDAPEFERWLDAERARLKSRAQEAAWAAAKAAEQRGDVATAVERA